MPIILQILCLTVTALVGFTVLGGLYGIVRALRQKDRTGLRKITFLVFRLSLFFAGGVVLIATQGRGQHFTTLLLMAFCVAQVVAGLPPIKAYLAGSPRGRIQ